MVKGNIKANVKPQNLYRRQHDGQHLGKPKQHRPVSMMTMTMMARMMLMVSMMITITKMMIMMMTVVMMTMP